MFARHPDFRAQCGRAFGGTVAAASRETGQNIPSGARLRRASLRTRRALRLSVSMSLLHSGVAAGGAGRTITGGPARHPHAAPHQSDAELPAHEESSVVQLLPGHTKLESAVRYLGIEVNDALAMAEQTHV